MQGRITFAFAQLNPTVGDISGNLAQLRAARARAAALGADVLVTTELFLCAYPAEDLLLKPSFQKSMRRVAQSLAEETADGGPAILLGMPWREDDALYNAFVLLEGGAIAAKCFKHDLPNYGPFDEKRVFTAGPLPMPIDFRGYKIGLLICEDMWRPEAAAHVRQNGAELLIVPNGSPFEVGKTELRRKLAGLRVNETGLPLVYLNQVGGQDELVFDGRSFALNADAGAVFELASWRQEIVFAQWDGRHLSVDALTASPRDREGDIYAALMTGLRDYVEKNGFPGVVLGLSGGVDSALAAALAVDALGADRVWGVMLPSPYTSQASTDDAQTVARALGCRLDAVPIDAAMKVFDASLAPVLGKTVPGVVAENIQARCRGLILMALSNATGHMVLSTGNKSEMSVGYATLYGDMCGGFAVLKDVYKTEVYKLARWRNAHNPATALGPAHALIPETVLTKAPTAELRPGQTDQDSLPPYDVLDGILENLIERDKGVDETAALGFDAATVTQVWAMLDRAEYKRRQAPPGVKITGRNLSRDRRYPITNKYRERAGRA